MKDSEFLKSQGVNVDKGLTLLGDKETYDDILNDFIGETEKKIIKITEYKQNGNMPDYAILVHSLKSDSKTFGFEKLAELAYNHEMEAKKNNPVYVNEHFDELMTETNRIMTVVKQYFSDTPVGPTDTIGATSPAVPTLPQNRKTILVVDDSVVIRKYIQSLFQDQFEVLVANDGREAINIVNQMSNKLIGILLDLNMPNVDGFEVLEYFKQYNLFERIPVSIITGDDSIAKLERAFKYQIVDMLRKPFNEESIKKIVERTVNFASYMQE